MGRTLPSMTQVFYQQQESFADFRRALRRSDQLALDDLFVAARKHISAAAYASHPLPFEIFLLTMLLEEHKETLSLRREVSQLQSLPALQGAAGGDVPLLPAAHSQRRKPRRARKQRPLRQPRSGHKRPPQGGPAR